MPAEAMVEQVEPVDPATSYPRSMQARLRWFCRDQPGRVDAVIAVAALGISAASMFYVATLVGWPVALVLSLVPPLALLWRSRHPPAVLAVCLGFALAQWALAVPFGCAQAATLIALYTVARNEPRRSARIALGACLVVVLIGPLRQPYSGPGNQLPIALTLLALQVLGVNVGLRQRYLRALEERAERLERERDTATQAATLQERARIAREMHDVVAHHVSVMVVQAEGAGWAIDTAPDQARTAVTAIAETGRSTLAELRRLLGVLRDSTADGIQPQPRLADLPRLIDGFRSGGLQVDYRQDLGSQLPGLSEGVQLAAFRIIQEGLTNVLKHAGPQVVAQVQVRISEPDGGRPVLLVELNDNGVGPGQTGGSGHGLIGIRERVALFGGEAAIGTGPGPDGGFRIRATLPVAAR